MEDGCVKAEQVMPGSRDHGLHIHTLVDKVCQEVALSLSDLQGIVVLNGPGSYTGLRIALSVAKGFCYGLNVPLFLLNKLDVMAIASLSVITEGPRAVIGRARADEYFYGLYDGLGYALEAPQVVNTDYWINQTHPLFTFQASLEEEIPQLKWIGIDAGTRCKVSFDAFLANKSADLMQSEPFYLKNVFINKINKL
jgi:tRNA threonylcarbamoyladenosine biosynthesis protein TsaB